MPRLDEVDKRLAKVESYLGIGMKLGGAAILLVLGWLGAGTYQLLSINGDLRAIKQYVKERGGQIVSSIDNSTSTQQLAASLSLATAEIRVAQTNDSKPNLVSLQPLRKAVLHQSSAHPALPETWQAIAALASYRSLVVPVTSSVLPDCDMSVKDRLIPYSEIPEIYAGYRSEPGEPSFNRGYLFRNCTAHMSHLPAGALARSVLTSPVGSYPAGSPIVSGSAAYFINCVIVLDDSGIEESEILEFTFIYCRLRYQVNRVPDSITRNLLTASLDAEDPSRIEVKRT